MTAQPGGERPTRRAGRYARLRISVGRHPADLLRVVAAAGLVLAGLLIARARGINPVELAIFTQIERLPSWSARFFDVVSWCGSWPGVVLSTGVALYAGRVRMGASLVAAAVSAWLLTLLLHWLITPRTIPARLLESLQAAPQSGTFPFPSVHEAVIAALVTVSAPYLTRGVRSSGWVLVVLVGVAEVFDSASLPVGALAGVILGWGTGIVWHLVLGAPGRVTSEQAVRTALEEAGLPCGTVVAVPRRWLRPFEFDITTGSGEQLRMTVVRRLHRLTGPAHRWRRLLASVEDRYEPTLTTPAHEVAHSAYMSLLAERAGIGVVPLVLAGEIEHGPPFLLRRRIVGRRLCTVAGDDVTDTVLDRIWRCVGLLGESNIAHHGLRADNIVLDDDNRPRIIDFTSSRVGGPAGQVPQDVAEMLASVASVVGVGRAVDSAVRSVPTQALCDALPHLQWLALPGPLRRQLSGGRGQLARLRQALADQIGHPSPRFRSPVRPVTLLVLIAVGLAIYLLLPELSGFAQVRASLYRADWRWIAVAIVAGFAGVAASAVTILGSSRQTLPLGKTTAVQLAAAFTGRTTVAGVGFYGINVVFLERAGLTRAHAVGVVVLNRAMVGAVTGGVTALSALVIGGAVPVDDIAIPTGWPVIAVGVALVALVALLASPVGRRRVWAPLLVQLREVVRELAPVLRRPVRALQLFGGALVFLALQAAGLAATLAAFQPHFPLLAVLAVYVVGSTLGQLVPTPGGLGAVEAATIAGLTAIGIGPANAVAAVLTSRVLTFWLPALPGLVAFRLLQRHDVI